MKRPFWIMRDQKTDDGCVELFLYPALVRAGDAHIFTVLGDGAARDLNALRLQNARELLVGERPRWIFFLNQFFDAALQNEQAGVAALGTLHTFAEKIAQLKNALRRVRVFAG